MFVFDVGVSSATVGGLKGMIDPSPAQDIWGGEGTGVSIPSGALSGNCAKYGYRWSSTSLTGLVKSINASSIDAFSCFNEVLGGSGPAD